MLPGQLQNNRPEQTVTDRLLKVDDALKQFHKFRCLESVLIEHERGELDSSVNNDDEDSCKASSHVSSEVEDEPCAKFVGERLIVDTNLSTETNTNLLGSTREESEGQMLLKVTNNKIKNIIKSSRSNSIDQLIAAAAATASGHSPPAAHSPHSTKPSADNLKTIEELSVSRKNLNTIVEAIFHVEGKNLLEEFEVANNVSPNASSTASTTNPTVNCVANNFTGQTAQNQSSNFKMQPKPPKKRKYTTEDMMPVEESVQTNLLTPKAQLCTELYPKTNCENLNNLLINGSKPLAFYGQSTPGGQSMQPAAIIIINNNSLGGSTSAPFTNLEHSASGSFSGIDSNELKTLILTSADNCLQMNSTVGIGCQNNEVGRALENTTAQGSVVSEANGESKGGLVGLLVNS